MEKQLTQVSFEVFLHLRYLCQDKGLRGKQLLEGLRGKQLLEKYPKLSKVTIYCHAKISISGKVFDKRKLNKRRPRKVTSRDKYLFFQPT